MNDDNEIETFSISLEEDDLDSYASSSVPEPDALISEGQLRIDVIPDSVQDMRIDHFRCVLLRVLEIERNVFGNDVASFPLELLVDVHGEKLHEAYSEMARLGLGFINDGKYFIGAELRGEHESYRSLSLEIAKCSIAITTLQKSRSHYSGALKQLSDRELEQIFVTGADGLSCEYSFEKVEQLLQTCNKNIDELGKKRENLEQRKKCFEENMMFSIPYGQYLLTVRSHFRTQFTDVGGMLLEYYDFFVIMRGVFTLLLAFKKAITIACRDFTALPSLPSELKHYGGSLAEWLSTGAIPNEFLEDSAMDAIAVEKLLVWMCEMYGVEHRDAAMLLNFIRVEEEQRQRKLDAEKIVFPEVPYFISHGTEKGWNSFLLESRDISIDEFARIRNEERNRS